MSRPQDVYFDYNARQQRLRERARPSSRRPRKRWPPLPSAEDELISLSHELGPHTPDAGGREARFRGSLDQQPIILDVDPPISQTQPQSQEQKDVQRQDSVSSGRSTSSDESSAPDTPMGSREEERNQDRRYVFIPQEGVEIPLTYDEPRTPIHAKHSEKHTQPEPQRYQQDNNNATSRTPNQQVRNVGSTSIQTGVPVHRGRKNMPKLDTEFGGNENSQDVPVQLERERSPYRSAPKAKETRFSGGYLLSPELMSPQLRHPGSAQRASGMNHESLAERAELSERHQNSASRPAMMRHASATAASGEFSSGLDLPSQRTSKQPALEDVQHNHRHALRLDPSLPQSPRRSSAVPHSKHGLLSDQQLSKENARPPRALSIATDRASVSSAPIIGSATQQSLNAMLSSPSFDRRRASPRNSPRSSPIASPPSSPFSSPPRTPPTELDNRKFAYMENVRTSASNSRPSSPLHPSSSPKPMDHLTTHIDGARHSRPAVRSRQTSPLPSAMARHFEPDPMPRIDIRSPSPLRHRRSSTYDAADQRSRSQHRVEQSTQTNPALPQQSLRPGTLEHRRRSSSAVDCRPQLSVNSTRDQEMSGNPHSQHPTLKSPITARAASVGAPPATLPPCPRSLPVGGYNDWYCLDDYTSFKICPSCREAVSEAGYGRHLAAAFSKSPDRLVRCSFSIPWIRMAYLLMVKKRRSDVNLLYGMADVAEDTPPCPGKRPAIREWYRLHDVDSDRNVPGFFACPYCIHSLETIFPVLRGVFHKSRSHHSSEERACSLRSDSSRFATYVDLLEDTANQGNEYRRAPNIYRFVELTKKTGAIPPCSRDDMLRGKAWHIMPKLPELTACSECYEDVVWPAVLRGLPVASRFTKEPQVIEKAHIGVSCQMYSSKMRKVFLEACEDDDYDYLRKIALKRYKVERELQERIVEAQGLPRAQRETAMEDIVDEWQEWDS